MEFIYPEKDKNIYDFNRGSKSIVVIKKTDNYIEEFYVYSVKFHKAANLLLDYLLNKSRNNANIAQLDTYIFPLVFLYRHSLELLLKHIGLKLTNNDKEKKDYLKNKGHDLEKLLIYIGEKDIEWNKKDEYKWLLGFLSDFSSYDDKSDSFRYPFHIYTENTSRGKKFNIKAIFEEQTDIDLRKLSDKFKVSYKILKKYNCNEILEEKNYLKLKPIFIEGGNDYYGKAVIYGGSYKCEFYPYLDSYSKVANEIKEFINENLIKGRYTERDILFLPMCYLYRNAVELSFKRIIFEQSGKDNQEGCKILNKKKHKIKGLWKAIYPYVKMCLNEDNIEDMSIVEEYIEQINNLDSDASKFRYPINKDLQLYFSKDIIFDYKIVGDFMEALINFLDGIDAQLDSMKNYDY